MANELVYNCPWKLFPRELYPRMIREYLDWGVDRLVFGDTLIRECLNDPTLVDGLHRLEKELPEQKEQNNKIKKRYDNLPDV